MAAGSGSALYQDFLGRDYNQYSWEVYLNLDCHNQMEKFY